MSSVTEALMDAGSWRVLLKPTTRDSVLADIDVKAKLWDTIVVTPADMDPAMVGVDKILASAIYRGVYLRQPENRLGLEGQGMAWWLGGTGDGGSLFTSVDQTVTGLDFEGHVRNGVIGPARNLSNGLAPGQLNGNGTTFNRRDETGDTPRELLDTLCAAAPAGWCWWRVNPADLTLDADRPATLWPSQTTPTVMLSAEAGRDPGIVGLRADLSVDGMSGEEVRTGVYYDWNDGANIAVAQVTLPAAYTRPDGGTPRVRFLLDWRPNRPKPPTERWRRFARWVIRTINQARTLAASEAETRANVRPEVTAAIQTAVPHDYDVTPGNRVWLWSPEHDLVDTANQVEFRGETTRPTSGRVDEMEWPIREGMGVYLLSWPAGVATLYWLTPHVEFGEGPATVQIGTRDRFPIGRARVRMLTRRDKRRWFATAHRNAKLARYLDAVSRRRR